MNAMLPTHVPDLVVDATGQGPSPHHVHQRAGTARTHHGRPVEAERALAEQWVGTPIEGPIVVGLMMSDTDVDVTVLPCPPCMSKKLHRGDIDNYAKLIMDGLNGRAWVDDRQIDCPVREESVTLMVPQRFQSFCELCGDPLDTPQTRCPPVAGGVGGEPPWRWWPRHPSADQASPLGLQAVCRQAMPVGAAKYQPSPVRMMEPTTSRSWVLVGVLVIIGWLSLGLVLP